MPPQGLFDLKVFDFPHNTTIVSFNYLIQAFQFQSPIFYMV